MVEVYLGLGSNIDAERSLEFALTALEASFGAVHSSRVYPNPAVGVAGDDFLNLVARVATRWPPARIQHTLRDIERAAGRSRREPKWGPRVLDIDLLLYGTCVDPLLHVPRGDILRYAFALGPLAELAPGLVHPVSGITLADAWRGHPDARQPWTGEGHAVRQSVALGDRPIVQPSPMVSAEEPLR